MSKVINVMDLSATRRRRGVICTSVTRLEDCFAILEAKEKLANADHATIQQLLRRLETLDGWFKTHYFAIVDLVEEEILG